MKRKIIILLTVVLCLLIVGCSDGDLVRETDKKADIKIKDGAFAVTVEQCIEILNADIEKEDLPLISTKYNQEAVIEDGVENELRDADDGEAYTIYSVKITDTIELQMRSFKRLNGGIPVIEIVHTTGNKSQKGDAELAKQYFNIICENVEPRFAAEKFNSSLVSNDHYELGDLFFWCGRFNRGQQEAESVYLATTNSELFDFYFYSEED